jgi:hypothetical protein
MLLGLGFRRITSVNNLSKVAAVSLKAVLSKTKRKAHLINGADVLLFEQPISFIKYQMLNPVDLASEAAT